MEKTEICPGKRRLTISDKKEILQKVEELQKKDKLNINYVSKTLNLPRSTLLTILSKKHSIEATPESEKFRYRAKNKRSNPSLGKGKYQALEEALCYWIRKRSEKSEGNSIHGFQIRKKALTLAKELGFTDFRASNGWCCRFKKKYSLEYKTKEKNVCIHDMESKDEYAPIAPEDFLDVVLREQPEAGAKSNSELYEIIFRYLSHWVTRVEATGARTSRVLLRDMALALAGALGVESFTGSNSWLDKFQKRRAQMKYGNCQICNPKE